MGSSSHMSRSSQLFERIVHLITPVMAPIAGKYVLPLLQQAPARPPFWLRLVPAVPQLPESKVWPEPDRETPDRLRSGSAIERDPDAEQAAFEEQPLHYFNLVHPEAARFSVAQNWPAFLGAARPLLPVLRGYHASRAADDAITTNGAVDTERTKEEVTRLIREEAVRLGLSTIGFAPYDPKYTFQEFAGQPHYETVIACIYEQNWEATQTAPSLRSEAAVMRTYVHMLPRVVALANYVRSLGYHARPQEMGGEMVNIHYCVAAGLGQLGLNGQLLTPEAGSRCRLMAITTNAPVVFDEPVDYGIQTICDECQVCVKRCPVGAIPKTRKFNRGVMKAKINLERCLPTVSQAHGCAICMKVCPVQRYGLDKVKSHFMETGEILGKGSDELEGYEWPLDEKFYGASEKPRITGSFTRPLPLVNWDSQRKVPRAESATDSK